MSQTGLIVHEHNAPPKGHLKLEVYRGDPERMPLTSEQAEENRLWRDEGIILPLQGESDERIALALDSRFARAITVAPCRARMVPIYVGRIIDFPIEVLHYDNLVTTTGKGLLLDRWFAIPGSVPAAILDMGVGNSATAAAIGDTQLLGSAPVPFLKVFDALPTRTGLVVTAVTTFLTTDAGSNLNWQEIALFNGGTNGTSVMANRIAPIGPFNKTAAVSIAATITMTQS